MAFDTTDIIKQMTAAKPAETATKRGAPKKADVYPQDAPTNKRGLKLGWTRKTMVIRDETLERLENYCYTERLEMKQAVDDILSSFLDEYEKGHELLQKPKAN